MVCASHALSIIHAVSGSTITIGANGPPAMTGAALCVNFTAVTIEHFELVCLHTLRSAFRPQLGALRYTDAAEANDAILIISIVVRQLLRHSRLLAPATNVPTA